MLFGNLVCGGFEKPKGFFHRRRGQQVSQTIFGSSFKGGAHKVVQLGFCTLFFVLCILCFAFCSWRSVLKTRRGVRSTKHKVQSSRNKVRRTKFKERFS